MRFTVMAMLWVACAAWAQAPVAPPIELPKIELPKPEAAKPDAPSDRVLAEPEKSPVLQNTGKPMLVPFQCTDDDMQWAGMSCSEEDPCPVYLEVSAVETVGNRIVALANIHSEAMTLYSVVLVSNDAGATWREAYERMRGTGVDHVQFVDFQNGWISGQALAPVSHDPFLLITSDGGQTWRLRPVFSEGGGAIHQFWFESPSSGSLVIDRMQSTESSRYELYESPNAGETWMIRRTGDQPMAIKRAGSSAPNPGWRIRADERSKSFVIEKRQGDGWNAAASFLVDIGRCRPAPRVAPAPPPDPAEPAPDVQPAVPPKTGRRAPSLRRTPPQP